MADADGGFGSSGIEKVYRLYVSRSQRRGAESEANTCLFLGVPASRRLEKVRSAGAAVVEESLEAEPQLFREVLFAQRLQEGDRRSERAHEVRALRAAAQVLFEVASDIGRQPTINVIGQEGNEAGAVGAQ